MDARDKSQSPNPSTDDTQSPKPKLKKIGNDGTIKETSGSPQDSPQKQLIPGKVAEDGLDAGKDTEEEEEEDEEDERRQGQKESQQDDESSWSPEPVNANGSRKRRRSSSASGTDYGDSDSENEQSNDEEENDDDDDGDDDDDEEERDQDKRRSTKKIRNGMAKEKDNEAKRDGSSEQEQPPLPPEAPPGKEEDDGWQAIWDDQHQAYYFYNSITGESTWTNPRVPQGSSGTEGNSHYPSTSAVAEYSNGEDGEQEQDDGYAPTYYQLAHGITDPSQVTAEDIAASYTQTGTFNRFSGKFQKNKNPEIYNDENKSKRQMEFYFDVDAAANSHDGRSLKAERQMRKLSKKELKAFREKKKEKKEQKRRAWLKD